MILAAGAAGLICVATTFAAPIVLAPRGWTMRRPAVALRAWLAALLLACVAGLTSAGLLSGAALIPGTNPDGIATAVFVALWGLLIAAGALIALVATRCGGIAGAIRRDTLSADLIRVHHGQPLGHVGGLPITVIPAARPAAFGSCSAFGRHIVLTTALVESLSPDQVRAVAEHERAHLVGFHQWLVRLGSLNRACFPRLPCARSLDRSIRLLTELVADDAAADACGRECVSAALLTMARLTADESLIARGRRVQRTGAATRRMAIEAAPAWISDPMRDV